MNISKKFCVLFLCVCMLVSVIVLPANAASTANASMTVSTTKVKVGDTITVTLTNRQINVQGFGVYMEFDKNILECTEILGVDGDEYLGMYKTSGKSPWVDAVGDDVANTNSDGIFSFGVLTGIDTEFKAGDFATLTFVAKAEGSVTIVLNEDTAGTDKFMGIAGQETVVVSSVPVIEVILETQNAASVRLSETHPGLRFKTLVKTATIEALVEACGADKVQVGTLIAPTDLLGANKLTHAFGVKGVDYIDVEAVVDAPFATVGDTSVYAGSIVNIKETNLGRDFTAVGYVKVNDTYYYSEAICERNVCEIAIAAYDDVKAVADAEYKYEIVDNTDPHYGKFSPYKPEHRDILEKLFVNVSDPWVGDGFDE